jgi:cell division septum initiation protein DivIVA
VSDRVAGWLKGEVQEFRDGVKREIDDFRSAYDKLRRGVRQLRSKIRGD